MATKLYLHNAASGISGILPSAEQSALASSIDFEAQTNNRSMDTTIGTSQTNKAFTGAMSTSSRNYYVTRFVSPLIYQNAIAANTWTYSFAHRQTATGCNFPVSGNNAAVRVNIYVWRPSNGTKVGTILDGNTAATVDEGAANADLYHIVNLTGAQVTGLTVGDAVLVIEVWFVVTSTITSSQTLTFYYDGTTEHAENGASTSAASNISTPENLSLGPLSAVSKESIQPYSIRKEVPKESIQIYAVRKSASKESIQLFNIRKIISKEVSQLWNVRKIIAKEITQLYNVEEAFQSVFREITQIYAIRAIAARESIQLYSVRQFIFKESTQIFRIFNSISRDIIQIYNIRHLASKESTQIWNITEEILTPVFRELTQIYAIRKGVANESIQRYDIRNIVSRITTQLYTIAELPKPFKRKYPRGHREIMKPIFTYFVGKPGMMGRGD